MSEDLRDILLSTIENSLDAQLRAVRRLRRRVPVRREHVVFHRPPQAVL